MVRILEFVVNKQRLMKKKGCDFTHLVAGSVGYLYAKFEFVTDDWDGCKKAASFWFDGKEYAALLNADGTCLIPKEALMGDRFKVSLTGKRSNYQILSSEITVKQEVH